MSIALCKRFGVLAASLCLLASVVLLGASALTWNVGMYLHAQRLVDIGGRQLNIYCSGQGSPTVILAAGMGDSLIDWRLVQPAVAKQTRVCSYDAAGIGFSDPAPLPRDANAWVFDLHQLLSRARIAPPYVLVGHSVAGLYVRLYADRYPHEVVGLVLVDGSVEYQYTQWEKVWPGLAKSVHNGTDFMSRCYRAAKDGEMRPGTRTYRDCIFPPPYGVSDHALIAIYAKQWERPDSWLDQVSEWGAVNSTSSDEVREAQRSYGSLPLVVLTAGNRNQFAVPGASLRQENALWEAWKEMHDRIAALSSRGENIIVRDSGHFIEIDRPTAVIESVHTVIDEARSTGRK
jgi:pimeloyl-ACP methyl ester carboxylesterase